MSNVKLNDVILLPLGNGYGKNNTHIYKKY